MTQPLEPSLFALDPKILWVLHCAVAPVPRPAAEAARAVLEQTQQPWRSSAEDWLGPLQRTRAQAARLFGAQEADLTLASGTSDALTTIAQTFTWHAGDEVLAPLGEFPSNVWPWKALAARGVRFREVPLWSGHLSGKEALGSQPPTLGVRPEERLLEAIGPKTRMLTVSWVRFQDGLRLDLQRLGRGCAERGVRLVVDGIQGAGTLPVDLEGVSAFATGVHKGLMAPQGLGLLWTSRALRDELDPLGSWLSVEDGASFARANTDFERAWLTDGRKLEHVTPNNVSLSALEVSLRLLNEAGPARIAAHVDGLQRGLLERLARNGSLAAEACRLEALRSAGRLGSFLSLHHGGRGNEWLQPLLHAGAERGVIASAREGYLRIALHGWHTEADLDRIAEWLQEG